MLVDERAAYVCGQVTRLEEAQEVTWLGAELDRHSHLRRSCGDLWRQLDSTRGSCGVLLVRQRSSGCRGGGGGGRARRASTRSEERSLHVLQGLLEEAAGAGRARVRVWTQDDNPRETQVCWKETLNGGRRRAIA